MIPWVFLLMCCPLQSIWSSGLHRSDPRLRECFFHMRKLQDADGTVDRNSFHRSLFRLWPTHDLKMPWVKTHPKPCRYCRLCFPFVIQSYFLTSLKLILNSFEWAPHYVVYVFCYRCVTGSVSLILKALQGRFVIPDFSTFTEETQKLFSRCRQLSSVQVGFTGQSRVTTIRAVHFTPVGPQVTTDLLTCFRLDGSVLVWSRLLYPLCLF